MKKSKLISITFVSIVIGILGLYFYFLFEPTLQIEESKETVEIKTLLLGEYYSPVETLNIFEVRNNINVVVFEAKNESSRMHTVRINPGINSFDDMYLKEYNISYPTTINYKFKLNTLYKVVVKWQTSSKEASFTLHSST